MYLKHRIILLFCLFFSSCSLAHRPLLCKVVSISDGDTFTCLLKNHKSIRVRLANIDAPEKHQPFGTKAKQVLAQLIYQQQVKLNISGYDAYQRTLAVAYTAQGKNVNLTMVKVGMAWAYEKYQPGEIYRRAQRHAQQHHLGLWQDAHPISPEHWRKQKRIH